MKQPTEPQEFIAEEMLSLRGTIVMCFAQIEFILLDIILKAQRMADYHRPDFNFPYSKCLNIGVIDNEVGGGFGFRLVIPKQEAMTVWCMLEVGHAVRHRVPDILEPDELAYAKSHLGIELDAT